MNVDQLAVAEPDVDRLVDHALAAQALVEAEFGHQVDRALLQHTGAHAVLNVRAAARFEHDALDAFAIEQMGEKQPCGARADDGDLRVHFLSRRNRPWRHWRRRQEFFKCQSPLWLGQFRERLACRRHPWHISDPDNLDVTRSWT